MNQLRSAALCMALACFSVCATTSHAQLTLFVDSFGGGLQLTNPLSAPISLSGYQITSLSGALDPSGWISLQAQGLPNWTELSASPNGLAEMNFAGTTFSPGQSFFLGSAYNYSAQDLAFEYAETGGSVQTGQVFYGIAPPAGIPGDYNDDGLVGHADYSVMGNLWGQNAPMPNRDPSATGPIGAIDFQLYRASFGSTVALAGSASGGVVTSLPMSVTSSAAPGGNTEWVVRYHDVQGALASHLNFQTSGANILSIEGGGAFLDDNLAPTGVPGFSNFATGVQEGVAFTQNRAFAALGTTLGAPFSSTTRDFVRIVTAGTAPTSLLIQGQYGYQGVTYSINQTSASAPGATQVDPILPTATPPGQFIFPNVPSGAWFDPPLVESFEYVMDSASLFTSILDFPTGFDEEFIVSAEGATLGQFGPGEEVDFLALLGHGVSRFIVSNITPLADAADPNAFPLKLEFSTPTASFRMLAVPEPGTIWLVFAACSMAICRRQR